RTSLSALKGQRNRATPLCCPFELGQPGRPATRPDPLSLAGAVRKEVRAACPDQPIGRVRTMNQVLGEDVASPRLVMSLMAGFSALATCLAAIGVFGVIARSVSERRQEICVRVALGARPADVMRLVIGRVARLMLAGLLIGLALALPATRLLSALLFGVTPTDPATFSAMIALLVSVTLAAGLYPSAACRAYRSAGGAAKRIENR
ncbi:MAG: FtsX-like permease family protein, partial [Acidobacteriota bacterium]